MNVQQHIMPQLQDLYQGLEKEFSPLKLCARVNTIFEFLQENEDLELAQYIKPKSAGYHLWMKLCRLMNH